MFNPKCDIFVHSASKTKLARWVWMLKSNLVINCTGFVSSYNVYMKILPLYSLIVFVRRELKITHFHEVGFWKFLRIQNFFFKLVCISNKSLSITEKGNKFKIVNFFKLNSIWAQSIRNDQKRLNDNLRLSSYDHESKSRKMKPLNQKLFVIG